MALMLFGVLTVATVASDVLDKACDPNLFSRMVLNTQQLHYNVPSTNNRSALFFFISFTVAISRSNFA